MVPLLSAPNAPQKQHLLCAERPLRPRASFVSRCVWPLILVPKVSKCFTLAFMRALMTRYGWSDPDMAAHYQRSGEDYERELVTRMEGRAERA